MIISLRPLSTMVEFGIYRLPGTANVLLCRIVVPHMWIAHYMHAQRPGASPSISLELGFCLPQRMPLLRRCYIAL
jgi:hypothetical protein